jgi:serralysin
MTMTRYIGTAANNVIRTTAGNDSVSAYAGNDYVTLYGGNDVVSGGTGSDTVRFDTSQGIQISLSVTTAQTTAMGRKTLISVENVVGSTFDDRITGSSAVNNLFGEGGNDFLSGLGGNDYLTGGTGDDIINGGTGRDSAGFHFSRVGVSVDLGISGAQNTADGLDTFVSIESVFGSVYRDTLIGNAGVNTLNGNSGADFLAGYSNGQAGGGDTLVGGRGADTFAVLGMPTQGATYVHDFVKGTDKLNFEAFERDAINDFIVTVGSGRTFIRLADPGDGESSDLLMTLRGTFTLTADDFVL